MRDRQAVPSNHLSLQFEQPLLEIAPPVLGCFFSPSKQLNTPNTETPKAQPKSNLGYPLPAAITKKNSSGAQHRVADQAASTSNHRNIVSTKTEHRKTATCILKHKKPCRNTLITSAKRSSTSIKLDQPRNGPSIAYCTREEHLLIERSKSFATAVLRYFGCVRSSSFPPFMPKEIVITKSIDRKRSGRWYSQIRSRLH